MRHVSILLTAALLAALLASCGPQKPAEITPTPTVTQAVVYASDQDAERLVAHTVSIQDTPQALVDELIALSALPEGTQVLSFTCGDTDEAGRTLGRLDLSEEFGTAADSTGTSGELMLLSSLTNTFCLHYDLSLLAVTVEGQVLETGHNRYDQPLGIYYALLPEEESYTGMLTRDDLAETESMAREYYDSGTTYQLLSLRLAADGQYASCLTREELLDCPPGQVAVYEAETDHAGTGIYRHIVFLKEDSGQWSQLREGY